MEKYYEKSPLGYQISEYDCATATLLNALRFLYERDEISPGVIKYIMQESLDGRGYNGEIGRGGTSTDATIKICKWLAENCEKEDMKMHITMLKGDEYSIDNPKLVNAIKSGGVAILRVFQEYEHYSLLTHLDDEYAYLFDPYYLDIKEYDNDENVEIIKDRPFECNRKVSLKRMRENSYNDFCLVKKEDSVIIIIEK